MKRMLSVLLLLAIVASMIPTVAYSVDGESLNSDDASTLFDNGSEEDNEDFALEEEDSSEMDSSEMDSSQEEIFDTNLPEDEDINEEISPGLRGFQEIAPLASVIPANARVFDVNSWETLSAARDIIRGATPGEPVPAAAVIRITGSFTYTRSGALPFNHPNLQIVAGPGHFRVNSLTNAAFIASPGGNMTISGGFEGGSLTIEGDNAHGTGIIVQGTAILGQGGNITNYPESGVNVQGGRFILDGGRIHHNRVNRGTGLGVGGGGVRVSSGIFEMKSGIIEYNTAINGGGVLVAQGARFEMSGGQIRNNFSINYTASNGNVNIGSGGGLFVPASNLGNVAIGRNAIFSNNVAESGIRVDNDLAVLHQLNINPGTVSVTNLNLYLTEDGTYGDIGPHAFTNYDINTDQSLPKFWEVSYRVAGNMAGNIVAKFGSTEVIIPNGAFVPEGTEVIFVPEPAALLERWEIGTRLTVNDEDGREIPFKYTDGGSNTPLSHIIVEHTRIIGHFTTGFTITKDPNWGQEEPFVRMVKAGPHTLAYEPRCEDESYHFAGWNTLANGNGISYNTGDTINVNTDITLYAMWERGTTSLTVSKEVTGDFGNRVMDFEFTISFTDGAGEPLLEYTSFNYRGEILSGSGVKAPEDGVLTLDENGSATFKLKHGQAICIEDIPIGGFVQIIEARDDNYEPSCLIKSGDVENVITGNDTGVQPVNPDLEFRFVNERRYVPPTGIYYDYSGAMLLLPALVSLPALGLIFLQMSLRRVKE